VHKELFKRVFKKKYKSAKRKLELKTKIGIGFLGANDLCLIHIGDGLVKKKTLLMRNAPKNLYITSRTEDLIDLVKCQDLFKLKFFGKTYFSSVRWYNRLTTSTYFFNNFFIYRKSILSLNEYVCFAMINVQIIRLLLEWITFKLLQYANFQSISK
jgi:hypothetical protein